MKKLHALVLGATGATGQELVKLLLKNSDFSKVSVFVRRPISINHEKLIVHKVILEIEADQDTKVDKEEEEKEHRIMALPVQPQVVEELITGEAAEAAEAAEADTSHHHLRHLNR